MSDIKGYAVSVGIVTVERRTEILSDASYLGFTQKFNGGTFTVSNNQYVAFMASGSCTSTFITIKNQSDGNATLDTFDFDGLNC